MPHRLMDDLKGDLVDEKVHKSALGYDILSADPDGEDALLSNICERVAFFGNNFVGRPLCRGERLRQARGGLEVWLV